MFRTGVNALHFVICISADLRSPYSLLCMIGVNNASFCMGGNKKKRMKVRVIRGSLFVSAQQGFVVCFCGGEVGSGDVFR